MILYPLNPPPQQEFPSRSSFGIASTSSDFASDSAQLSTEEDCFIEQDTPSLETGARLLDRRASRRQAEGTSLVQRRPGQQKD